MFAFDVLMLAVWVQRSEGSPCPRSWPQSLSAAQVGAQVMLLKNLDLENEQQLVNGSRGVVTSFVDAQVLPGLGCEVLLFRTSGSWSMALWASRCARSQGLTSDLPPPVRRLQHEQQLVSCSCGSLRAVVNAWVLMALAVRCSRLSAGCTEQQTVTR